MSKISDIHAIQVFDSRGIPTISCKITLDDGVTAFSMVPSGASTGSKEALELRDNDKNIKVLLSYADNGQGHVGGIYKATNWIYQGLSTDIALMPNWGISLTKDPHDWIHSLSLIHI